MTMPIYYTLPICPFELLEGYAEYYSIELSQKVKRGMNETRLKGNFTGGHIPYGYKKEGKKLVIDEDTAEVVHYIYEQYSLGVFVKDIIKSLTDKGILYNNKPFAKNTVYKILKSEKYSGIYHYENQVFDNIFPQIVPSETFQKVRDKVDKNKYGKRSTEVVYLLKNKAKCGYCGRNIGAECGTGENGQKKRYYKCLGRKSHNGCTKAMIRKDFLENFVIDSIIKVLTKPKNMDIIIKRLLEVQEEQSKGSDKMKLLLKEKRKTETALDNLVEAITNGISSNRTNQKLHELENKLEDLERKILIEKNKSTILLTEQEMREFYEQALKLQANLLLNVLVKKIILYDDKIEIIYNTPLNISPDTQCQGFCFYIGIDKMPYIIQNKPQPLYRDMMITMYV